MDTPTHHCHHLPGSAATLRQQRGRMQSWTAPRRAVGCGSRVRRRDRSRHGQAAGAAEVLLGRESTERHDAQRIRECLGRCSREFCSSLGSRCLRPSATSNARSAARCSRGRGSALPDSPMQKANWPLLHQLVWERRGLSDELCVIIDIVTESWLMRVETPNFSFALSMMASFWT